MKVKTLFLTLIVNNKCFQTTLSLFNFKRITSNMYKTNNKSLRQYHSFHLLIKNDLYCKTMKIYFTVTIFLQQAALRQLLH